MPFDIETRFLAPNISKKWVKPFAAWFCLDAIFQSALTVTRVMRPNLFYREDGHMEDRDKVVHPFLCGVMLFLSAIHFTSSAIMLCRNSSQSIPRWNITIWQTIIILFETGGLACLYLTEVYLENKGYLQLLYVIATMIMYLIDSIIFAHIVINDNPDVIRIDYKILA